MITMYQRYLRDSEDDNNSGAKISKKMGYVANVRDAKIILEKKYYFHFSTIIHLLHY